MKIHSEHVTLTTSQEQESHTTTVWSQGSSEFYTLTNHTSNLNAGGNLTLSATNDLTLTSSHLSSNQDLTLKAGNAVAITANNDVSYSDVQNHRHSLLSSHSQEEQNLQETVIGSTLHGTNITITSDKDTTLQAANLTAKDTLSVEAGGDINVVAGYDGSRTLSTTHDSQLFSGDTFSKSETNSMEILNKNVVGSHLSGNNVALNAQKSITIAGSDITGNTGSIEANNALSITALTNTHSITTTHQESSVDFGTVILATGAGAIGGAIAGGGAGAIAGAAQGFLDSTGIVSSGLTGNSLKEQAGYRDYSGEKVSSTQTTLTQSNISLGGESKVLANQTITINASSVHANTLGAGYTDNNGIITKTNPAGELHLVSQEETTLTQHGSYSESVNLGLMMLSEAAQAYVSGKVGQYVQSQTNGHLIPYTNYPINGTVDIPFMSHPQEYNFAKFLASLLVGVDMGKATDAFVLTDQSATSSPSFTMEPPTIINHTINPTIKVNHVLE